MFKSLRTKLLIGLLPLLAILTALGLWAILMFARLGGSIEVILRENYRSVLYAERMNDALERMDSALLFAVAGEREQARRQFALHRPAFDHNLELERQNVTLIAEGEQQFVDDLGREYLDFLDAAQRLLDLDPDANQPRRALYFDQLLPSFQRIKSRAEDIRRINQENMLAMDRRARSAADRSIRLMTGGLVVGLTLGTAIALGLSRSILRPIQAVTSAARKLGAGDYDQEVPSFGCDEPGQLAAAFNSMASQLRSLHAAGAARLLRAQQTAQATIDAFPDPVVVVGPKGELERSNPAARQALATHRSDPSPLAWNAPESIRRQLNAVLEGGPDYIPSRFDQAIVDRYDTHERAFLPRILAIRDERGQPLGAAVVLQDVTRFRRLDQMKSNLVSNASHELKTPLTSVQMALDLLLERVVGPLSPKQAELVVAARHDAERLRSTVEDLLDLTRIEQGRLRLVLTELRPDELVRRSLIASADPASAARIELSWKADASLPSVGVDLDRIMHVFSNLIDNALAHSHAGGHVLVTAEPDGPNIRFSVSDNGDGIPAEHLDHIFDRFYRVPGSRSPHGAGLGLAIVREIVEAHGGEVGVQSTPGVGSTFSFTVPIAAHSGTPQEG